MEDWDEIEVGQHGVCYRFNYGDENSKQLLGTSVENALSLKLWLNNEEYLPGKGKSIFIGWGRYPCEASFVVE